MAESFSTAKIRIQSSLIGSSLNGGVDSSDIDTHPINTSGSEGGLASIDTSDCVMKSWWPDGADLSDWNLSSTWRICPTNYIVVGLQRNSHSTSKWKRFICCKLQ
jgi:hypothetical protein